MLFSSLPFLLGFLPAILLAIWAARRGFGVRGAVWTLLVGSLIFYAWQTPAYIFLIGASITVNFLTGRRLMEKPSRLVFAAGVAFNLALLGWFKYIGLFSSTFNDLVRGDFTIDGVVLPLAISFFTFQQIAFLADCQKGDAPRYGFVDYALFVAFFPQLIAGPIVHHKDLTPQFSGPRFARFHADDIAAGILLFSIGLAKKVLIADGLAPLADGVFDAAAAGHAVMPAEAWIGVIAYSFQIYFDFSGYSDMALGLAFFFGVRLPMNFNSPYKARSITDFWRRWHMTLSQFLRDYLYIPLGGNRRGNTRRYINLFITMLLGGLWHGAAWTFMVWGALHGAYLCVNHAWSRYAGAGVKLGGFLSVFITFTVVTVAWVFFRAETFAAAFSIFSALTGTASGAAPVLSATALWSLPLMPIAAVIVWGAPNALEILEKFKANKPLFGIAPGSNGAGAASVRQGVFIMLGAASAAAIFILSASGPYEFIYFQF